MTSRVETLTDEEIEQLLRFLQWIVEEVSDDDGVADLRDCVRLVPGKVLH